MTDIAIVPKIATDANYDVGGDSWSGDPTKVAPSSEYEAKGWIPGGPISAEYENYHKAGIAAAVADAQKRAAVKLTGQGTRSRNTGSFYAWLANSKVLVGTETISAAYKLVAASSNLEKVKDSASATEGLELCFAEHLSDLNNTVAAISKLAYFRWGLVGGTDDFTVIEDSAGRAVSNPTAPESGAKFHDACTDVDGNLIMLSAGIAGTTRIGWAYGDPSVVMAFGAPATGTGWVNDQNATCASRPDVGGATEVRCFSPSRTFYSNDAGAYPSAVETMSWTGATAPATGTGFRATWDARNGRWIYFTADLSVDELTAVNGSKLWTSTNGKDWTYLGNPLFPLVSMVYHAGWLWAIGLCAPYADTEQHAGLEVFYSTDGGETWERPGLVLSFAALAYDANANRDYLRLTKITVCDKALVFQTAVDTTVWGSGSGTVEYLTVQTG